MAVSFRPILKAPSAPIRVSDASSMNAPAKRDLVGELAIACEKRGLGLFLYYSHGRDWKHPHAPNNDKWGGNARPRYDSPEPTYATGDDHDLQIYLDFIAELSFRFNSIKIADDLHTKEHFRIYRRSSVIL